MLKSQLVRSMLGERLALEQAGNLGGQPDTPFSPLWGQVWESQGPPPYHIMLSKSKTLAPVAHGLSFPPAVRWSWKGPRPLRCCLVKQEPACLRALSLGTTLVCRCTHRCAAGSVHRHEGSDVYTETHNSGVCVCAQDMCSDGQPQGHMLVCATLASTSAALKMHPITTPLYTT